MKKFSIGFFMLCLLYPAGIAAQAEPSQLKAFPLKLKDELLDDALLVLIKQFEEHNAPIKLRLTYDPEWNTYSKIKFSRPINCNKRSISLDSALSICFNGQLFTWTRIGHSIEVKIKDVHGIVTNEKDEPEESVTVSVSGTSKETKTNDYGQFILPQAIFDSIIVFSSVNKETAAIKINRRMIIMVKLKDKIDELSNVEVDNGYQVATKDKLAVSAEKLDSEAVNRAVTYGIIERLTGMVSGFSMAKNILPNTHQPPFSIRGRSTIFANATPLIVVDKFPFYGDINSINPHDIESINILKDAAATAIYGVLSGNGVIVITTKKGRDNQKPRLTVNMNSGILWKPDLHYLPQLNPSEIIDAETYLYDKGYYAGALHFGLAPMSPAIEVFEKIKSGEISAPAGAQILSSLRTHDIRDDYEKYFHRAGSRQQYAVSLDGGNNSTRYYLSAGYDLNSPGQQRAWDDRKTLGLSLQLTPKKSLEISATANLAFTSNHNFHPFPTVIHRYGRLYDALGQPQVAAADISQKLKDSIGGPMTTNWDYKPAEEFNQRNSKLTGTHIRTNIGARYTFNKYVALSVDYQLNLEFLNQEDQHSRQSYFARNLQNKFTGIDSTGLTNPVPEGGILDWMKREFMSNSGRAQLNFQYGSSKSFTIKSIAGVEIRRLLTDYRDGRDYGTGGSLTGIPVDFANPYPLSYDPSVLQQIPGKPVNKSTTDNFLSWYSENTTTYKGRYIFSLSGRIDASNKFGVHTNDKKTLLWSTSLGWHISEENFYRVSWLRYLKLRTSFGYNGNVDNTMSSQLVAAINNSRNRYNEISSSVLSPQNDRLRWEKVGMYNVGIDFGTKRKKIEGSIEFYKKFANHLIGESNPDPTGINVPHKSNTASLGGHGFDLNFSAVILSQPKKRREWKIDITASHNVDRVRKYDRPNSEAWAYTDVANYAIRAGWPVQSIVGYRDAGLDPNTGDPRGYIDGQVSTDYAAIKLSSPDELMYVGHGSPTVFGGIRNTFRLRKFEFSFLITGKGGYYFHKYIRHTDEAEFLFGMYPQDFARRWQTKGNESTTSVPSLEHPTDPTRYAFYAGSTATIERGDHLRLQDIRVSYDMGKIINNPRIAKNAILYLYINNPGLIYKATRAKIDPDALYSLPQPRSVNFGVHLEF